MTWIFGGDLDGTDAPPLPRAVFESVTTGSPWSADLSTGSPRSADLSTGSPRSAFFFFLVLAAPWVVRVFRLTYTWRLENRGKHDRNVAVGGRFASSRVYRGSDSAFFWRVFAIFSALSSKRRLLPVGTFHFNFIRIIIYVDIENND